jgi:lysozyme family protein
MSTIFDRAFEFTLGHEGGFSDHPADNGGATKYGVTIATLAKHRRRAVSIDDVKALTLAEAKTIYKKHYWDALNLDAFADSLEILSIILFDQAVNRGVVTVARQLQTTVGTSVDGHIGPKTISAIKMMTQKRVAYNFVKASQISYATIVKDNAAQRVFIVGWLRRSHKLLDLIFGS